MFLICTILYTIAFWFGSLWLKKKLNLPRETKGWLYKHMNRWHRFGEMAIIAVLIAALLMTRLVMGWRTSSHHDCILAVSVLLAFRAFVERRLNPKSRQHILSAYASMSGLILYTGIEWWM